MRILCAGFGIAAFVAPLAFAQQPAQSNLDRVLVFTHIGSDASFQQAVNVIRTLADIPQAGPASLAGTLALEVRAGADRVDLAEWLANQLDQASPASSSREYRLPGGAEVARVLPLAHTQTAVGAQEIVNAIRAITNMNRIMPFLPHWELAIRGTTDQADMAEWLAKQLDALPGTPPAPEYRPADRRNEVVRVVFLAHAQSPLDVQSVVNAIRTRTAMNRVMPNSARLAIVMRGTDDQVAAAAQLTAQMDIPKATAGVQ